MGRSTTIRNGKELEVSDCSHISLKFREENEVGLVVQIGPEVALEILRLRQFSGGKTVEIFVVQKYICIVIVIAYKMAEGETGAFNSDIANAVSTAKLEPLFVLSNPCTGNWI